MLVGLGIAAIWLSAEFSGMMRRTGCLRLSGMTCFLVSLAALCATFIAGIFYGLAQAQIGIIILLTSMMMMVALSRFYIYFACLLSACLFSLGIISQLQTGVALILFIAIVISACDIGAYCCGRIIGEGKTAPHYPARPRHGLVVLAACWGAQQQAMARLSGWGQIWVLPAPIYTGGLF